MPPGEVIIHRVDLSEDAPPHLDAAELARAARFHRGTDRRRWTAARGALRRILGERLGIAPADVPLALAAGGKPVLAPPHAELHFNLSHSDDLMLLALTIAGPVGIDVEPLARAASLAGCEETFCHPAEIAALPPAGSARHQRLLDIWTAKEALLKAAGSGLLHPPGCVAIGFPPGTLTWHADPPLPSIAGWELHALRHPDLSAHRAVLCAPPAAEIIFHQR